MKKYSLTAVLCGLLLAILKEARENQSLDDQLRAHLHKEYFTLNLLRNNGLDDASALTIVDNTLVAGQIFYLSSCRKIENQAMAQNSSRQYTG